MMLPCFFIILIFCFNSFATEFKEDSIWKDYEYKYCGRELRISRENLKKYFTPGFGFNNIGKRTRNLNNNEPRFLRLYLGRSFSMMPNYISFCGDPITNIKRTKLPPVINFISKIFMSHLNPFTINE